MLRKFRFSHSPPQAVALLLLVAAGACRPSGEPGPPPLRLADAAPALAAPAAGGGALPSGFLEVPFEDWRALRGTEPRRAAGRGLVLGSGSLVVRSWRPPVERRDTVESVELELTSTQPGTLRLEFLGDDAPAAGPTDDFLRSFSRGFEARLPGGDAVQQVLLQSPWSVPAQAIRSLALAAELAEGGNLEVRALRVRFQSAGLRVADSGIGLHGLHEIYHEAVPMRPGQPWRHSATVPAQARLQLAYGTAETRGLLFEVAVESAGQRQVLDRTRVRAADGWVERVLDLDRWGGRQVEFQFRLEGPAAAVGLWGHPTLSGRPGAAGRRPRSLLLIVADTLRRDHLSAYGYRRPTSPRIDRWAAGGVRFADAHAAATWTLPSAAALLSGRPPAASGVRDFGDLLPADLPTLATVARAAGRRTLLLSSIPFVGRAGGLERGFESVYEAGSLPREVYSKTAALQVDRALSWLRGLAGAPYFLLLHVADPHDPYAPEGGGVRAWGSPEDDAWLAARQEELRPHIEDPLLRRVAMPTRRELQRAGVDATAYVRAERDQYDESIRRMDIELGRLFDGLRELGRDGDTVIALVGDHGEEFLEHGRHYHGQSVQEELSAVPWLLRGPGVPAGVVVEPAVSLVDLFPTAAQLSGLPVPQVLAAHSLVESWAQEGDWRPRPVVVEKAPSPSRAAPPPHDVHELALLDGTWRLVQRLGPGGKEIGIELQDRRAGAAGENAAVRHPEVVEQLRRRLAAWKLWAAPTSPAIGARTPGVLDAAARQRLEALGYLGPSYDSSAAAKPPSSADGP